MADLYAIIGIGKLKTPGNIQGVLQHMTRGRETPNSNGKEKIAMIKAPPYSEIMAEINSYLPRKNAVLAYDILLTASPEFFDGKSPEQVKEWAETSLQWAKQKFGENNNIQGAILHLDESCPHIQILSICSKNNRLNARFYTGGREKLRALWTEYAAAMKPYGLERGKEYSPAKHTDIKAYYAAVNKGAELAAVRKVKAKDLPAPELGDRMNPRQYAAELINRITSFIRKENGNMREALEAERKQQEELAR